MDLKQYTDDLLDKLELSRVKGAWEEVRIQSGGIELFCPVFAAGEGKPTVVFIPGTSIYALCYAEIMYELFARGFNVVGFDPKGQGQSGGVRGDYTILEHVGNAIDAARYARDRFKGPVFAMGSSQGGIEAFYLAATKNNGVDGVVCHNIADLPDPESIRMTRFGPKKGLTAFHSLMSKGVVPLMSVMGKLMPSVQLPISIYLDLKDEPMRVFGNAWNFIEQDPLALTSISMRAFASIATTPLPCPPEKIETPVMVLHSSGDNIFPEDYVRKLFDKLTCEKLMKVYEGLPHLITIEYVDKVVPDTVAWLNSMIGSEGSV